MRIETVKLSNEDFAKALTFTSDRESDSDLYVKRGNFKSEDIAIGALGELAVYTLLKQSGIKASEPDFRIYETAQKSYSADITTECGLNLHVKSQSIQSAKMYGRSYLLQRTDKIISKPSESDLIVPCLVDFDNLTVEVYGFIPMVDVHKKDLIGECRVPYLRRTKVAIYLDELAKLDNLWRLL